MKTTELTCSCEECKEHPRGSVAMEHRKICRALTGLDEKHLRRVVGLLALKEGHGGVSLLNQITGLSRTTILQGQRELSGPETVPHNRVRRRGGGRKPLEKKDRI